MAFALHHEGSVALLELHHGKANEMGSGQLQDLMRLADELETSSTRALITVSRRRTERGTPVFVSGADVTERVGWTPDQVKAHVRHQRELLARWRRLPLFHVAVVNGVALGWGTEYLLTADYRIGCPEALLGLPETGLGIVPGAGGSSELAGVVGLAHALRLGMTGERVSAEEGLRIGLLQELVADVESGLQRARALAAQVVRNSPTAVAAFKAATLDAVGLPAEARREVEARAYELCVDSGDAAVGRTAFQAIREGREVEWGPRRRFSG